MKKFDILFAKCLCAINLYKLIMHNYQNYDSTLLSKKINNTNYINYVGEILYFVIHLTITLYAISVTFSKSETSNQTELKTTTNFILQFIILSKSIIFYKFRMTILDTCVFFIKMICYFLFMKKSKINGIKLKNITNEFFWKINVLEEHNGHKYKVKFDEISDIIINNLNKFMDDSQIFNKHLKIFTVNTVKSWKNIHIHGNPKASVGLVVTIFVNGLYEILEKHQKIVIILMLEEHNVSKILRITFQIGHMKFKSILNQSNVLKRNNFDLLHWSMLHTEYWESDLYAIYPNPDKRLRISMKILQSLKKIYPVENIKTTNPYTKKIITAFNLLKKLK